MIRGYFNDVEKKFSLDFRELVSAEHIGYRFHFMNGDNRLIKRWDSAPHHKEIASFPFHLHTPEGVIKCDKVNLIEVIGSIETALSKEESAWGSFQKIKK